MKSLKKNNPYITPKNLENILKLFIKFQEKKLIKKKRKRKTIKKLQHQQHRNEQQANIRRLIKQYFFI